MMDGCFDPLAELGALDRIDKAAAAVKLAEFLKTVV